MLKSKRITMLLLLLNAAAWTIVGAYYLDPVGTLNTYKTAYSFLYASIGSAVGGLIIWPRR